jgi:hypothetical protein
MMGDSYVEQEEFLPNPPYRVAPEWLADIGEEFQPLLKQIYSAADQALYTLAAMGIRAVVDMVLTEQVGDVGGFEQKLKKAIELGLIKEMSREPLAAVIDAGHASAHRGHLQDEDSYSSLVVIMEHLLHRIYVAPREEESILKQAQKLRDSTPKRK